MGFLRILKRRSAEREQEGVSIWLKEKKVAGSGSCEILGISKKGISGWHWKKISGRKQKL